MRAAQEKIKAKVLVLGSGPGGYSAAFRAADLLGEGVVLVERYKDLGGVCLNVGCIPSKQLLHVAEVINESKTLKEKGVHFGDLSLDIEKIRSEKNKVVQRLTGGLAQMAKMRKVTVLQGVGSFTSPHHLWVEGEKTVEVEFEQAIIAVGSRPVKLPFLPDDPRVIDSTGALKLEDIPPKMLIIGAGIIGLEMGTVYSALGSSIDVVELTKGILPGVDSDLAGPLFKKLQKSFAQIYLGTKVVEVIAKPDGLWVKFEGDNAKPELQRYDKILCAVGRVPNGKAIGAEMAGIQVDDKGFIPVDNQQRTNIPHIYAIGDVAGNPMLAHKAIPEGRVAAEVIAGKKHYFNPLCIPSVAYTDPEVAWVGVTELEAKAKNIAYEVGVFPWMASGRALSIGRDEGSTKLIFSKETKKVIGAGIVGPRAGDLISEVALAIEMGCEAEDISLTIHPHPTLSETIALAAEVFEGTVTDLPNKKRM